MILYSGKLVVVGVGGYLDRKHNVNHIFIFYSHYM